MNQLLHYIYLINIGIFYFMLLIVGTGVEIYHINHPYHTTQDKLKRNFIPEAIYFILCIVGLFTTQWLLFFIIFLLSIIANKFKAQWYVKLDGYICIIILVFIVINKYHLRLFFY